MRRSTQVRQARQGRAKRRSLAELDADMQRLFPRLPPDPRSPEQIAEAQAQADLVAAVAWGYRPDDPGSLAVAIQNLELAAAVRRDPYSERADTGAVLRAQDRGDLARRLRGLLDDRTKPIHSTLEQ